MNALDYSYLCRSLWRFLLIVFDSVHKHHILKEKIKQYIRLLL